MNNQVALAGSSALDAFYAREQAHPDKTYLIQPLPGGQVQQYTWGQVGDQARRLASYLLSLELAPGSCIALVSRNCAHWIIADLAIWMAGHVSVPLYPNLTADSARQIIEHSESRVVLVGKLDDWASLSSGLPEDIPWVGLPLAAEDARLRPWQELMQAYEPMTDSPTPDPEALATIVYTSGTTGMPKGVMLSFAGMYFSAKNCLRLFGITDQDRLLSYLPLCHVAERQFVEIASLLAGETVYFSETFETFLQDMQRARPTVFFGVPRIWVKLHLGVIAKMPARLLDAMLKVPVLRHRVGRRVLARLGLDQIRYAVCGAAPVPPSLLEWYKRLGLKIAEVYGMTENCGYSHLGRPRKLKPGWIGLPNPGVECRIAEQGEVLVRSKANMLGYYKDPERTAETLDEQGFVHTGDVGEIDNEGFLRLTGRLKDLFKTSKGKYVAPGPIESLLAEHERVEQVCVVGDNLPQPLALIQLSELGLRQAQQQRAVLEQMLGELLLAVNARLDRHEKLGCLVVIGDAWRIENGFMTPTLKIKRSVVEATYREQCELWSVSGQPVVWHAMD